MADDLLVKHAFPLDQGTLFLYLDVLPIEHVEPISVEYGGESVLPDVIITPPDQKFVDTLHGN